MFFKPGGSTGQENTRNPEDKLYCLHIISYLRKKNKTLKSRMFARLVIICILGSARLLAQESAPVPLIACPGGFPAAMPEAEVPVRNFRLSERSTARFIPRYFDVPDSVQKVVETAVDIWGKILISPVPIHLDVYWETMTGNTLASAGSERVYKNFENAPLREVWYPSALADALSGRSVNANNPDIVLKINRDAAWNLNYEGPANFRYYDMLSVIIHEIAHGIGFMSSFEASGTRRVKWGVQNLPFIYDHYLADEAGNGLVNHRFYTNDSESLLKEVTERSIFFKIDSGAYHLNRPRLHTPTPFSAGASLSHISDRQPVPVDHRDRLMLPTLLPGARYHFPGDGILAILFQMGWALNFYEFEREYGYLVGSFSVFPNPANDLVLLKINAFTAEKETFYYLLDASGRVVKQRPVTQEETEIS